MNSKDHTFLTGDKGENKSDLSEVMKILDPEPNPNGTKSYWTYTFQPLLTQTSEHLCQVRFHYREESRGGDANDDLKSYLFFDDLWVESNPVLAESILRYSERWDVLFDAKK